MTAVVSTQEDTRPLALKAASAYLATGWAPVALHGIGPDGQTCSCGKGRTCPSKGKHPIGNDWASQPMPTEADLDAIWLARPRCNVGIRTGATSGIFVLDVDTAGKEAWEALVEEHGLPETTVVQTGSGMWHYYFLIPAGVTITNSSGSLPKGIDVRGNGGQVVAPPSRSDKGDYTVVHKAMPAVPPQWLLNLILAGRREPASAPAVAGPEVGVPREHTAREVAWTQAAVGPELARLDVLRNKPWAEGDGWHMTGFEVACQLAEIANTEHAALTLTEARRLFMEHAPHNDQHDERDENWTEALGTVGRTARPPLTPDRDIADLVPATSQGHTGAHPAPVALSPELDVTNPAEAIGQLRTMLGTGPLAGVLRDGSRLIDTPRIGEHGYIPPEHADEGADDGPAQVRELSKELLAALVQHHLRVYRTVTKGDESYAVPAVVSALIVTRLTPTPELLPNVRPMRGVTHTPMMRADGSVLDTPGYDNPTGYLYLPPRGLQVQPVPAAPTAGQVAQARDALLWLFSDFPWLDDDARANFLGALLVPLVRAIAPPPYKLLIIEAPERGSGKSLLAKALRLIHGGVNKVEMPANPEEFRKLITTTLRTTTAPVVVFDNVSGKIGSSELAGLLTTVEWTDRLLGGNEVFTGRNTRLWTVTSNNAAIVGDLARRSLLVTIDPEMPHPEKRTGFAVDDLSAHITEHRGAILAALLTLVRSWHVAGRPAPALTSSDDYGQVRSVLQGILTHSGIPGAFDAADVDHLVADDDDEHHNFLTALAAAFGENPFTAKDVLARTNPPSDNLIGAQPIQWDALPSELADKYVAAKGMAHLSKSLGWYLRSMKGRWARDLRLVVAGQNVHGVTSYRVTGGSQR